jgi:hypothetical protein
MKKARIVYRIREKYEEMMKKIWKECEERNSIFSY